MAEALDLVPRTLAAFEIGCLARPALQPGQRGRVGAVFERSFYVTLADTEVCVGPAGLGAGPAQSPLPVDSPGLARGRTS
jgi:hypothetical protein